MANNYCHKPIGSAYDNNSEPFRKMMKSIKVVIVCIIWFILMLQGMLTANAGEIRLSDSEEELICRFANAAAGEDSPLASKLGIINVVLNRLAHSEYPDSVAEVIFEEGEFECVRNGRINNSFSHSATVSARDALRLALLGRDPTEGALNFADGRKETLQGEITFEAGGFLFG